MSATTSPDAGWKDFPWLQFAYGELMDRVARFGSVDSGGHNVHAHDKGGHVMNNPRIVAYFKATSLHTKDENTSWCSAFANWCVQQAGIEGTRSAMARSWLTWKGGVDLKGKPVPGAVVVFARGKPPSGHVAFVWTINADGSFYVLGGNQGGHGDNAKRHVAATSSHVSIGLHKAGSALGFMWPKSLALPGPSAETFLRFKTHGVPAGLRGAEHQHAKAA